MAQPAPHQAGPQRSTTLLPTKTATPHLSSRTGIWADPRKHPPCLSHGKPWTQQKQHFLNHLTTSESTEKWSRQRGDARTRPSIFHRFSIRSDGMRGRAGGVLSSMTGCLGSTLTSPLARICFLNVQADGVSWDPACLPSVPKTESGSLDPLSSQGL